MLEYFSSNSLFWIHQLQSLMIVVIMLTGFILRKNGKWHGPLMAITIVWDLLLVAQIQWNRHAIQGAIEGVMKVEGHASFIMNVHLFFALSTVLLYFFMLYSGFVMKFFNQQMKCKNKHKLMGMVVLVFRISTLITSFMIDGGKQLFQSFF